VSGTLPCRNDTQCRPRFGDIWRCRRHVGDTSATCGAKQVNGHEVLLVTVSGFTGAVQILLETRPHQESPPNYSARRIFCIQNRFFITTLGTPLFYSGCRIFCTQNRFFITSLRAEYSARMINFLLKWRLKFYYYSANYSASN